MARRLKSLKVDKLALCRRGKNGFGVLYKSADLDSSSPNFSIEMLCKGMDEQGLLTAVVYAPNRADADGHQASNEVIRKAAHEALKNGLDLNLEHEGEDLDRSDAFVAESFIVQKGDKRFADLKDYDGKPVGDLEGAWAVLVQVENEQLRAKYRKGEWQGISLEGSGRFEVAKSERSDAPSKEGNEDTMTPEQITALTANLQKSVTDAIKPVADRVEALEKAAKDSETLKKSQDAEKLKKSKRLARELAEAATTEESDLILAKAEVSTISEKLVAAIEAGDVDEIADLRKSRKTATETVEKLQPGGRQAEDRRSRQGQEGQRSARRRRRAARTLGRTQADGRPHEVHAGRSRRRPRRAGVRGDGRHRDGSTL
jgi:hypothetical protein